LYKIYRNSVLDIRTDFGRESFSLSMVDINE